VKYRARVGDVFAIAVADDRAAWGQVIAQSGPQFLVVLFDLADTLDAAISSRPALAGIVLDAKLRNGDWPVVANRAPIHITQPWFVLGHGGLGNLRLESFDGSSIRTVSASVAARHGNRHIVYPAVLGWAAEATWGPREWILELDHLRELAAELRGDHPG